MFPDVSEGDDVAGRLFSAGWINHVTRSANPKTGARGGKPPREVRRQFVPVDVLNIGAAIDAPFPILRLTDPVVTVADNEHAPYNDADFKATTPDADTGAAFVVVQGPLASGAARTACLLGLTWCKVDVADEDHTHATSIEDDNTKLASGTAGAVILWKESGEGEKWALILLGGSSGSKLQWGESTGTITAATGWTEETMGTGEVQFKNDDGTDDGEPAVVKSKYRDTFDGRSIVVCDRSFKPPRVVAVGCTLAEEAPEE